VADSVSGSRFLESSVIEVENTGQHFGIFHVLQEIYFVAWGCKWVKIFACAAFERAVCFCAFELCDSRKQS